MSCINRLEMALWPATFIEPNTSRRALYHELTVLDKQNDYHKRLIVIIFMFLQINSEPIKRHYLLDILYKLGAINYLSY